MFRLLLLTTCASLFWIGCSSKRAWRVAPSPSGYALTNGKQSEPYSQMLQRFNRFETGSGWVDIKPYMRLQVENAYYEPGRPKRGLNGFIGTERVWYRKPEPPGLIEGGIEPKMLAPRPVGEPAVETLLASEARKFGAYRLFFSVRINRRGATRGAVLLGAPTESELESRAAALLADPDSVCREGTAECTVFPEVCTVAPEIEVTVNGEQKVFIWGTALSSAVGEAKQVRLTRLLAGKRSSVPIDAADKNALRLPLLPGDEIRLN
jgi:hypothetical protein